MNHYKDKVMLLLSDWIHKTGLQKQNINETCKLSATFFLVHNIWDTACDHEKHGQELDNHYLAMDLGCACDMRSIDIYL